MSCQEISQALSISKTTAKTHRRNLMGKFKVHNAAQLLFKATELRLLEPKKSSDFYFSGITPREKQIMELLIEGKTSKSIARSLKISDLTVRKHRENLLKKLNLRSTTQLAACIGIRHREYFDNDH